MTLYRAFPRALAALALVAAAVAATLPAGAAEADDAPWQKGSTWVSFRGGYAKSLSDNAPNGNVGWGMGYHRVLSRHLAVGATVEHDLIGRFGASSIIEVPMGGEVLILWRWKTHVHPMLGAGFGAYYRKYARTGADRSDFQPGVYLKVGANTPIDPASLLGVEVKLASVSSDADFEDPVFLRDEPSSGRVSAKLVYTRAY